MEDFRKKHPENQVESTSKRIDMNKVTSMWVNKSNSILFYIQRLKRLHRKTKPSSTKMTIEQEPPSLVEISLWKILPPPAPPTAPFSRHKHTRTISKSKDSRGKGKKSLQPFLQLPKGSFSLLQVSLHRLSHTRSFPTLPEAAQLILQGLWLLPVFTVRWSLHDSKYSFDPYLHSCLISISEFSPKKSDLSMALKAESPSFVTFITFCGFGWTQQKSSSPKEKPWEAARCFSKHCSKVYKPHILLKEPKAQQDFQRSSTPKVAPPWAVPSMSLNSDWLNQGL